MQDKFPEVVSTGEVIKMVGFGKSRIYTLLREGRFPEPKYILSCGRLWLRADIYAFLNTWDTDKLGPWGHKRSSETLSSPG